nr:hypothetical protein [Xenorhabdus bovienii]
MQLVNIIKPTHRCNLACKYCYNEDIRNPVMTIEVLEKTIKDTFDYANDNKVLVMTPKGCNDVFQYMRQ